MNKLPTISIGILAYNEEKAIAKILHDVYAQVVEKCVIKEVIIFSDGSNDNTVPIVKSLPYKNIKLIQRKQRKGMVAGLNALCEYSSGDCLIILNADIRIRDVKFVEKMVQPILEGQADLTSCDQHPFKPRTLVEHALVASIKTKTNIFESYNNANNVYTCHGTARAFSKKLYKQIVFSHSVGEDAYAYLFATHNKMKYAYVTTTRAYFRAPSNYEDHYKQSVRFDQSRSQFVEEFGDEFVSEIYRLPMDLIVKEVVKTFLQHPISLSIYLAMMLLIRATKPKETAISNTWEVAHSSKETE